MAAQQHGGWRPGNPPGRRQFAALDGLSLELGGNIPNVTLAYETYGTLNREGTNAVLVLHALTGDSHVAGAATEGHISPGWWNDLVGPGKAVDTNNWFVVCPNVLGGCQGSTGPSSLHPDGDIWGARFPTITIRDQVAAEILLADTLHIDRFAAVIGGSMGGMRVLEWGIMAPERMLGLAPIAVSATATADQIGLQTMQINMIRSDPAWKDGTYLTDPTAPAPTQGLMLARQLAHWSYRSREEFSLRFTRRAQDGEDPLRDGRFAVSSYLEYHGTKLAGRFDAASYVALTHAMNTHDVGRGRGGVSAALAQIRADVIVAGIDSDRLYPLEEQHALAHQLHIKGDRATVIRSPYGHDGFLIEAPQVGRIIGGLLTRIRARL
ncbi:MAG: homoserine O-acetyltransferase [Nitriliruptoraceae bacterium]